LPLTYLFYVALVFSTIFKIVLAVIIPLTGDEAYHYVWGKYLDFGYYDHPPLIGWLMHLMQYLGDSRFILRLPTILFGIIIGIVLYQFLKKMDKEKAQMISILFWISPFNLLNVIITNDSPLLIFTFLSGLFFFHGFDKKRFFYFLIAGVFLGLAFSSKYFAVLLAVAFLFYVLFFQRNRKGLLGILGVFLPAGFFVLLNLYWNYTHCWDNIVFNFFIRHKNPLRLGVVNFAVFILEQIYLITPIIFYYLMKGRKSILESIKARNYFLIFLILYGVPICIFALVSLVKSIGFHWTLSFVPFIFFLMFPLFSQEILRKMIRPMFIFSTAHLVIVFLVLLLFHMGQFNHLDIYKNTIISIRAREISSLLKPVKRGFLLATESYDDASMLHYYCREYVTMIGKGSHRGRQFDQLTDFIKLQGKNILIVRVGSSNEEFYKQFFHRIALQENRIDGIPVFFLFGYKFNFPIYKEKVLKEIWDSFYPIPSQLPYGKCYFRDHYFNEK